MGACSRPQRPATSAWPAPILQHPVRVQLPCGAIRAGIQLPVAGWKSQWPKEGSTSVLCVPEKLGTGTEGRAGAP